ncbi:MAG: hypothetical protein C5B54_05770 [Acidobacteria bacterium]|nr:MAG: hypothetical protein C5B54_05770 [Acidobacteriota bacterium]
MKRLIVLWVVLSVVGSSLPVWAQSVKYPVTMTVFRLALLRMTPDLTQEHVGTIPAGTSVLVAGIVGEFYHITLPSDGYILRVTVDPVPLFDLAAPPVVDPPIPPPPSPRIETDMRSERLFVAGLLTSIVGLAMAIPRGTTYNVLDHDYCVAPYSIEAGSCSVEPSMRTVGLIALGSGVLMMVVGGHHVQVSASRRGVAVVKTVVW